jgi:hypothetical protein
MIVSMIRGEIFRMSWLVQTLYCLIFRNFSIHFM